MEEREREGGGGARTPLYAIGRVISGRSRSKLASVSGRGSRWRKIGRALEKKPNGR